MNCINKNTKEFIELLEATKLPSLLLEMRISEWQNKNGLENFPTIGDISTPEDTSVDFSKLVTKEETNIFGNIDPVKGNNIVNYSDVNRNLFFNEEDVPTELDINELLQNIITNFDLTDNYKVLLDKSRNLLSKTNTRVRILTEDKFEEPDSIDNTIFMYYSNFNNTITLRKESFTTAKPEILLKSLIHEVSHATTVNAFRNPKTFEERELKKFIEDTFIVYEIENADLLKKEGKDPNDSKNWMYGFTNELEFIAEIYSNPEFQERLQTLSAVNKKERFWIGLLNAIRRIFGFPKNEEYNTLIESTILIKKINEFVEKDNSDFKGTMYEGSYDMDYNFIRVQSEQEVKTDLRTLDDRLNDTISQIQKSIKLNIDNYNYRLKLTKDEDQIKKINAYLTSLNNLTSEINSYKDANQIKGIVLFVNNMKKSLDAVQKSLNNVDYKDVEYVKNAARLYDDALTTYSVIDNVEDVLSELLSDKNQKILSKEDLRILRDNVNLISGEYNLLIKRINYMKMEVMKSFLDNIKYFPELEKQHYNRLAKEFKDNNIPGDKESWIIDKINNRDKDIIQEELEDKVNELINNPAFDIYATDVTFSSSVNVSSPMIQIMNQILLEIDNRRLDVERKEDVKFRNLFNDLVKEKGTNNIDVLYQNILQYDSTGKPYLLGEYDSKFYTDVHLKIKNLRQTSRLDIINLQNEAVEVKNKKGINSPEYIEIKNKIKNLKNKSISEISKLEKDNFLFTDKKITGIQDEWKNDLSKLTPTERKVRDYFIEKTQESFDNTGKTTKNGLINFSYGTKFYELPKITKSDAERLWQGDGLGIIKDKWEDVTEIRPDDIGFVSKEKNMDNESINRLRVHYRDTFNNFDNKNQSLDLFNIYRLEYKNGSTYKMRRDVETELNFMLDIVKNKKYYETEGTRGVLNSRTRRLNIIPGDKTNTYKMMNNMLESKFYDILNKSNTKIGSVDLNKAVNSLNATTSFLTLSLNVASGTANVLNAQAQVFLESFIKGHYITARGVSKANQIYGNDMINIMSDLTNPINTSLVNQINEMFNIRGTFDFSEGNFLKSDLLKRGFNTEALRIFQESGEHWVQSTITMAVLEGIKVLNENNKFINKEGKEVETEAKAASLLDMIKLDEAGLAYIDDKVVYTTHSRASKFDDGGKEKIDLLIIKKLNDSIGNYRTNDQPDIQRHWWGKLVMLYRKYLIPMGQARFRGIEFSLTKKEDLQSSQKRFSFALQENEEGTYTTLIRYLRASIKDGENWLQFKDNWEDLTDYEKHNIKRTMTEIVITSTILPLIVTMLAGAGDDDDELRYYAAYSLRRLDTELSAYRSIKENFKMMRSPIPSTRTLETALDVFDKVVNPFSWDELNDTYEQGINKGKNKLGVKVQKQLPVFRDFVRSYKDLYEFQDSNWGTGL